ARRGSSPAPAPANPYGGVPSGGITYPAYYRPTEYIRNNNNYFPGTEPIGEDEMRISFIGSTPFPPTHSQAGTCIMVELGNGKRFFFDFGSGCMRNIVAMQVAVQTVTDIFFTHLHVDHYADLPYLYAFAPWMGRWKPLRVHGPSGRTPRDGLRHLVEHMKEMAYWHTDSFNAFPIGDGYEVEVNEFDFRDDNGICYEQDGVTIRHWRRSHTKDGASAYRLDWNGLAFVWTGDGRPDELTAKLAKGVDVFVTELQPDTGNLTTLKYGTPALMTNTTIDQAHTPHYATGYLFNQVQPRLAMCTHFTLDGAETPEMVAGIRTHWKGLFQFGAPDVVVVNVTKDAIWTRKAALPDSAMPVRPSPADAIQLFDLGPTQTEVRFPNPRHTVGAVQEQFVRDREYDPALYYPADVFRKPSGNFPPNFKIDVKEVVLQKLEKKLTAKIGKLADRAKGKLPAGLAQELGHVLESAETPAEMLEALQHFGLEAIQRLGGFLKDEQSVASLLKNVQRFAEALKKLESLARILEQGRGSAAAPAPAAARRRARGRAPATASK
ncbi:MAG TPA: guanitoxin biosynthesis MBL fold metallo-hydrolase GntH, partial [Bryobacteraceae bacterium]